MAYPTSGRTAQISFFSEVRQTERASIFCEFVARYTAISHHDVFSSVDSVWMSASSFLVIRSILSFLAKGVGLTGYR